MRWYWIDRFLEFHSGRSATAIKNISLAEDHLHDHFVGRPMMPNSLVIEGLAQTGGLLVCEHGGFAEKVIMAKVPRAEFFLEALPGDTLTYRATIEYVKAEGAMISATSHKGDQLHAEVEIVFAHLSDPRMGKLFDPATFLYMMRMLGAYDVGRAADGGPLMPPPGLIEAADEAS
jgi:3-hydroxyacyl-[acyl-carrier-protein] dehydratase